MKHHALFAAAMLTVSATAPAQFVRPGPPAEAVGPSPRRDGASTDQWNTGSAPFIGSETRKIARSIRNGEKSGDITPQEARAFRRELAGIRAINWRSGAPDAVPSGAGEVRSRLEALRGMVNARRVRGGKP